MNKFISALCLLTMSLAEASAATATSDCPDFTDLTASYVEPYASEVGNVLVEGRHTIISEQGTDPLTGDSLKLLPDGETKVVKLGNNLGGNGSESLTYYVKPTIDNHIYYIKFAVVLENPNHKSDEQPYFSITAKNPNGQILENTNSYRVYAQDGLEDFIEYKNGNCPIVWHNWSKIYIDLGRYIGREVCLTIRTNDCMQNGHFGYAYFTGGCVSSYAQLELCESDSIILKMLDGFKSYSWNNGSDSATFQGKPEDLAWCDITSIIGEIVRIFTFLADKSHPMEDVEKATVCEGTDYVWGNQVIDTHFKGTQEFYGAVIDEDECSISYKTLILTTIPTYTTFNERICEGEDYIANGFNIKNPPLGILIDTIEVEPVDGCRHWNILNLAVVQNSISPVMKGNEAPCPNHSMTYTVLGNCDCVWTVPSNATASTGVNDKSISLTFKKADETILSVTCSNGCATEVLTKTINPIPLNSTYKIDSICQGTVYQKDGWNLGVQNTLGYNTHIRDVGDSCGSSDVLVLYVMESPVVNIKSEDAIVCPGKDVRLTTSNTFVNDETVVDTSRRWCDGYTLYLKDWVEDGYSIAIGDIWCDDGSIMHLKDFLKSGKTAKGIVYDYAYTNEIGSLYILSTNDENNGEYVPYDISTMDSNPFIASRSIPLDENPLFRRWNLINSYLEQIEGADKLEGTYWTKRYPNGKKDTHRRVFSFDKVPVFEDSLVTESAGKIRYIYEITSKASIQFKYK